MRAQLPRLLAVIFCLGIAAAGWAGELDGRWRCGRWSDTKSGHEGPLRAYFRQVDDGHYRVIFHGRFAKIVPFCFATTLDVVGRDGDELFLAGESRLLGFYKFTYSATADEHQFNAQYQSRRWSGEFHLSR